MPSSNDAPGLQRGQQDSRGDHGDDADRGRCRQQSAGPRPVEAAQPDGAGGAHLAPEQPGDQKARDDEEHVHADEPTTHTGHVSVKEDNGQHRDGAQALDVRAKSRLLPSADSAPLR